MTTEDASPEALSAVYQKKAHEVGFGLNEICNEYERNAITSFQAEDLATAGFLPEALPKRVEADRAHFLFLEDDEGTQQELDWLDLLAFYLEAEVHRVPEPSVPNLVGPGGILTGDEFVGYGCF